VLNQTFTLYGSYCSHSKTSEIDVFLRVRCLWSGRSALGRRLVLRCSLNNACKLKNTCKFTWFVVAKIRKSRDMCIPVRITPFHSCLNVQHFGQMPIMAAARLVEHLNTVIFDSKPARMYARCSVYVEVLCWADAPSKEYYLMSERFFSSESILNRKRG
jgi:hypothetical protein